MECCWRCEVSANRFCSRGGSFSVVLLCDFCSWVDPALMVPKALREHWCMQWVQFNVSSQFILQFISWLLSSVKKPQKIVTGVCWSRQMADKWTLRHGNKENWLFYLPLQSDHAACSNFTAGIGDDRVLPVCSLKYFGAPKHLLKWKCFKPQTGVNKFLRSCGMQGRGRGSD